MNPRDFFIHMFNDADLNGQLKILEALENAGILHSVFSNADDIRNQVTSLASSNEATSEATSEAMSEATTEATTETTESKLDPEPKSTSEPISNPDEQKDKTRCYVCNKRLGIYGITCKCGKVTCMSHRHPDHTCSYDWKSDNKAKLEKSLKRVTNDRLENRI